MHVTMGRIFPTEIAPSRGPGDAGPHLTQYGIELAKANRRALENGISIQSSCLSTYKTDGLTDIPVAVLNLNLGCWVEKRQILVPNLVEFTSRDLNMLIVSVSMTSYDKWFQFCSNR